MKIRLIRHKDIDQRKWDRAIDSSVSPLIYAYAWYLDNAADRQWDALVYGDYEAVFPLPWKRKYGLKYVYQPYFCQQLGLFAKKEFNISRSSFIKTIPRTFVLVDLQLNLYSGEKSEGSLKTNYQLDLNRAYTDIVKNYNSDLKKNLRKLASMDIEFEDDIPYEKVIAINRASWGSLNPGIQEKHYLQLAANCKAAKAKNQLVTTAAVMNGEILGASLFFKTPKYLFYLNGGITQAGKEIGIMNGIIDHIILTYSPGPLVLDFEGSEIQGVAYFYKKFGSVDFPYLHYKKHNLF